MYQFICISCTLRCAVPETVNPAAPHAIPYLRVDNFWYHTPQSAIYIFYYTKSF